ncbi:hypothetical protein K3757_01435 [Sulfitobacter sp. S223]|uniref:hypothetical protein n=1 Tax=Sulfitobacter sp. S223 TaxID=2867023 RepID=UPI0021A6F463|nr:hypothetical protein [Sulfitobacter sp. S223]UWR26616.1 hypothetical protein K3757_01435 [Sulfitobacter sp. S223]
MAEGDYNSMGRLGYVYWDCASYGFLLKEAPPSATKLFEAGYEKLSHFLDAKNDGHLTNENTNRVPIGLSFYYVSGPSRDFSLGYMWSKFAEAAYEKTWVELEKPDFDSQQELQEANAASEFRDKNCELLIP